MSYSGALKGSLKNPLNSIHSSAETELGRRLTRDESRSLSQMFTPEIVYNIIEKVRLIDMCSTDIIGYHLVWVWISEVSAPDLW